MAKLIRSFIGDLSNMGAVASLIGLIRPYDMTKLDDAPELPGWEKDKHGRTYSADDPRRKADKDVRGPMPAPVAEGRSGKIPRAQLGRIIKEETARMLRKQLELDASLASVGR